MAFPNEDEMSSSSSTLTLLLVEEVEQEERTGLTIAVGGIFFVGDSVILVAEI
jgi:hypothetical protein